MINGKNGNVEKEKILETQEQQKEKLTVTLSLRRRIKELKHAISTYQMMEEMSINEITNLENNAKQVLAQQEQEQEQEKI